MSDHMLRRRTWRIAIMTMALGVLVGGTATWLWMSRGKKSSEVESTLAERMPWDTRWEESPAALRIGMVGDSLSTLFADKGSMSELLARNISKRLNRPITVLNQGLPRTATDDWLPGGSLIELAIERFKSLQVQCVIVSLGTNDALRHWRPATPQQYEINLRSIAERLADAGFVVVLNAPPWADASDEQVETLKDYGRVVESLANGNRIFAGDLRSYEYFRAHRDELMPAGVHPNPRGLDSLARLWSEGFPASAMADFSGTGPSPATLDE